ncbi:MAG: winged helix-turn-helix transcriptional regulator, partial [Candidatus Hodarchaeota archaeon]
MNPKKVLDRKDLDIISALDSLGPKATTQQISKALNIPDRTVRYRLKGLKKNGFLQPLYPLIYDRKLGLGEHIVLVQEVGRNKRLLEEVLQAIPYFYWINSTFGKFTGILFNSIFSVTSPKNTEKIMEVIKSENLISDYFLFDITDFIVIKPELSYFDPKHGWIWDWDDWGKKIKQGMKKEEIAKEIYDWDEDTDITKFDFSDIILLRYMKQNDYFSPKQLGEISSLSERQVRRRIKRLEKESIIKGYISAFTPDSYYNDNLTYFFFELNEPSDWILSLFCKIPYQLDIFMETKTKYCITFRASSK